MESHDELSAKDDVILSEEQQRKVKDKFGEDPVTRASCLARLRKSLAAEENLHARVDANFLLRFLRLHKYDVDAALCRIKKYYKLRVDHPKYFVDLCPECLRYAFECELQMVLEQRDSEGRRVGIARPGQWTANQFSIDEIVRVGLLLAEHTMKDEATQINGLVIIADAAGLGFYHLRQLTLGFIRLCLHIVQDCIPVPIEAVHVINEPPIFDYLFAIAKPFIKDYLLDRIHLHKSNLDSLYKFIPKEILTEEYGGPNKWSVDGEYFTTMYEDNELFLDDLKYGYVSETASES